MPVASSGKQRITIRLDVSIVEHFKSAMEDAGDGNYQTAINAALREYIEGKNVVDAVRLVVRADCFLIVDQYDLLGYSRSYLSEVNHDCKYF